MSTDTETGILPYSSIDLAVGKEEAALTVICYDIRLHIQVTSASLGAKDESVDLRHQLAYFLRAMDEEPEAMQDFEDWLIQPCLPHIRHLIGPRNPKANVSLQDYFHGRTLLFILENVDGQLQARCLPDDPAITSHLIPKVSTTEPIVLSATRQGIPCLIASKLLVLRDPDVSDWEYNDLPKFVRNVCADGQQFYFKAAFEKGSFVRELGALMRITNIDQDTHATRIAGLVKWENDDSIGGLLIEYIPNAETLDWAIDGSTHDDRLRWMTGIRNTVGRLHDAGVVWGDVKPQNVLIDAKRDAWVVDFGGGRSLPWVEKDLEGTVKGDLQGLDAIAKYLGL